MRYRWGFIRDEFVECQPIVEDTTALDFAKQTGEVFYRAKLNGTLSFRFEFDDILAKGYNYEHKIVLQWYDESADEWKDAWMGRFALTDCEINYDTNTINVQPETLDVYTKILDNAETEYNLVKLNAQMQPVKIGIRACLQVYCRNDVKITNITGSGFWETDCDQIYDHLKLTYHFDRIGNYVAVYLKAQFDGFDNVYEGVFGGEIDDWGVEFEMQGNVNVNGVLTPHKIHGNMMRLSDEAGRLYLFNETGTTRYAILEFEVAGFEPTIYSLDNAEDVWGQWIQTFGRLLFRSEDSSIEWAGETIQLYDFPTDDIVDKNLNYNKVGAVPLSAIECIGSAEATLTPDSWGQNYLDWYFTRYKEPSKTFWSISPTTWKYGSIWVCPKIELFNICDLRTIADGYRLGSGSNNVLVKLFNKVYSGYEFFISRILNGRNDLGFSFIPVITPKSNVITSYYDTPAQKAPISLKMVLDMLKQAYQIYWAIDGNGNIHFEHIQFFENGWNYNEDETELLVDLESEIHTNTKNNKVFGQNIVKFDKQDMPNQYTFGWMDEQTRPFDGYAMVVTDNYVQKGLNEEKTIANFSTDIDYILATPSEISKDGFFLFACPAEDGVSDFSLKIERMNIKDEEGDVVEYALQNAEGAFAKIQKSLWRYNLSGENVEINNESSVALTTGNFKLQSVEFSDLAMAEILKDVNNCNKIIRTQQGNGHIKTISINLNSLRAKGDLLFNFVGRWYYLRGTALSGTFTITINGEQISIEVNNNTFLHKYKDAIESMTFDGANVVSVDFSDCDSLANLTSADSMFEDCIELVAVNFGGKHFSAVLSAQDMFAGCSSLTTLICPDTSSWKADLDFSDCPNLTTESLYDLIKFLFLYNSGTHTITTNSTMWNALDVAVQNDIIAKANAKGWNIAISTAYIISGTSTSNSEIFNISFIDDNLQITQETITCSVSGGAFKLKYKNKKIYSLDNFVNSNSLTSIDFSESDGLDELTSATDAFSGCTSLSAISIGTFTWLVDIVLSDCPIASASMLAFLGNFADYSLDNQHLVRISPYSAADMGADADVTKAELSAKNWRLPLSAQGRYTRAQLKTLVDNGYVPIATQADFGKIENDTPSLFAEDSEFYGTYTSATNGNSIVVQPITMVGTPSKTIGGVFDGNLLNITSLGDYGDGVSAFFLTNNGAIRNVFYKGKAYQHNSNCSFCQTNNGIIEDSVIDIQISAIVYSNAMMQTNDGIVRRCAIRGYHNGWPSADYWGIRWLWYANNGTIEDCIFLGTFKRSNNTIGTGVYCAYTNNADATINRCVCNAIANNPSTAFGLTNNGTITDCLQNSDRKFNRGAALAKTDAELKADAIGSGVYANYTTDIWDKDNDGYPIIKLIKDFDWGSDYTSIVSYDALYALATILETQITAETITLSTAFWNGLTTEQQATIQGVLQSKNYNLATA